MDTAARVDVSVIHGTRASNRTTACGITGRVQLLLQRTDVTFARRHRLG